MPETPDELYARAAAALRIPPVETRENVAAAVAALERKSTIGA